MAEAEQQTSSAEWLVEQLRLTAFIPAPGEQAQAWWDIAVGEPPDSITSNLREAKHRYEGPLLNGGFIMQAEFNRVDWITAPRINIQEPPSDLPNLGRLEEVVPPFASRMERWLSSGVAPIRLAWGVVLHRPVQDRIAGYRELVRFLPAVQIDEQSTDFFYQVNRRRMSEAVTQLEINRLQ